MTAPRWFRLRRHVVRKVVQILCATEMTRGAMVALTHFPALGTRSLSMDPAGIMVQCMSLILVRAEKEELVGKDTCDHSEPDGSKTAIKKYGNKFGSYAKCRRCERRWKFDRQREKWLVDEPQSSALSLRGSSQRPLPTCFDTERSPKFSGSVPTSPPSASRTRPRPSNAPAASPSTSSSFRPTLETQTFDIGEPMSDTEYDPSLCAPSAPPPGDL